MGWAKKYVWANTAKSINIELVMVPFEEQMGFGVGWFLSPSNDNGLFL